MKRYILERETGGDISFWVEENETGHQSPLRHHVRHSPDGMNWGYGGSGPSDLARSILIDYLGMHDTPDELPVNYQDFKNEFVAGISHYGGAIDQIQIEDFIARQSRERGVTPKVED